MFKEIKDIRGLREYMIANPDIFSITDTSNTYISNDLLVRRIFRNYGQRKFLGSDLWSDEDFIQDFRNAWEIFKISTKENFIKSWNAFQMEYNPIENYDRQEERTTTPNLTDIETKSGSENLHRHGFDSKQSGSKSDETTGDLSIRTGDITTNKGYGKTQTTSVNGYNQDGFSPSDKLEDGGHDTDTETFNNLKDSTNVTTTSIYNDLTNNLDLTEDRTYNNIQNIHNQTGNTKEVSRIHGNIGVVSSQKMVLDEMELRANNIIFDYIKYFIDDVTVYC